VTIPLEIESGVAAMAGVRYRWDEDTDILTAEVGERGGAGARTLSVDVEGSDGSWLIFDVADGRLRGVEVAVWPTVRKRSDLAPPPAVESVTVRLGPRNGDRVSAVEVDTPVSAESDRAERVLHFRLGTARQVRTVRVAHELLLDIDSRGRLAGLWLLDVPPFPGDQ